MGLFRRSLELLYKHSVFLMCLIFKTKCKFGIFHGKKNVLADSLAHSLFISFSGDITPSQNEYHIIALLKNNFDHVTMGFLTGWRIPLRNGEEEQQLERQVASKQPQLGEIVSRVPIA